ncbi:hypothetical protein ACG7TL_007784 [Trametes sanguinea]
MHASSLRFPERRRLRALVGRSAIGANIMELVYDIAVLPEHDPFIRLAEAGQECIGRSTTGGVYLVEILPFRESSLAFPCAGDALTATVAVKSVPAWFPGAGFKRQAAVWRQAAEKQLHVAYDDFLRRLNLGKASNCMAWSLMEEFGTGDPVTEKRLRATTATVYLGGAETSASALHTFFLAMALHPEVQAKAQQELDRVVGAHRLPTFDDFGSIPYIDAIVKEIFRWYPIVPILMPHKLSEEDVYEGYHLEKGSFVMVNIWWADSCYASARLGQADRVVWESRAILHDESRYADPFAFNPDRFMKNGALDPDVFDPEEVAFGFGRRVCPGRHLAYETIWIMITSVLSCFEIGKAKDGDGRDIEVREEFCREEAEKETLCDDGTSTRGGERRPVGIVNGKSRANGRGRKGRESESRAESDCLLHKPLAQSSNPKQAFLPSPPPPFSSMDIAHSDVEMVSNDADGPTQSAPSASAPSSSSGSSSPPPSSTPAHHSPAPDDTPLASSSTAHPPSADPADGSASSTEAAAPSESARGRKSKPSSSNVAAAAPGAKPKSTKAAAPRVSPSPPPPPARRPLQTIRLDITLGGPDDYEVNISDLAKATGQRPATPVPEPKRDSSDESEGDEDEGAKSATSTAAPNGKPSKKRKKVRLVLQANVDPALTLPRQRRHYASEYYDTSDPFIDDSELAQDERTFFAQTKQKGFYVSSGQVALLSKAPQRKPKSKKVNILAPSASVTAALSTATLPLPALSASTSSANGVSVKPKIESGLEAPIASLSDAEEGSGSLKRKMSETQSVASSGGDGNVKKKRKTVEIRPFHPELEQAIDVLKEAIAKEDWSVKGKFPPGIKPILGQNTTTTSSTSCPSCSPTTISNPIKLIKRTIWRDHTNLLLDRQNALIEELRVLAEEGFPKAKEEWERSVAQWEKRHERAKAEAGGGPGVAHSTEGSPAASDAQATPMLGTTALESRQDADDGGDQDDGGAGGGRGGRDTHPPAQRYRLTDQMKQIIWQLVCLSNECCRIENEKNALEGSNQIVSDQGVRKNLYQRIVAAFPEGWLSSGQISREVSVMKKKYEKESMEID